jgi:hypothetical protein
MKCIRRHDAIKWIQISHAHKLLSNGRFSLDEATRGFQHMQTYDEVPIWYTLAIQILLDAKRVFDGEGQLAAPSEEYRACVRKSSLDFQRVDPMEPLNRFERPFLEAPKSTKIRSLYLNIRNILKDHEDITCNDRWGKHMIRHKLQGHKVLGSTVVERNWIKVPVQLVSSR